MTKAEFLILCAVVTLAPHLWPGVALFQAMGFGFFAVYWLLKGK